MNKRKKSLLVAFVLGAIFFNLSAQQVNTMYFMENSPMRHTLNPAYQPLPSFYIGLPGLGNFQAGIGTLPFTVKDAITLNETGDKNQFYNKLATVSQTGMDLNLTLLSFGFRTKKSYTTFAISTKADGYLSIPKELLFYIPIYGNVKSPSTFDPLTGTSLFDWSKLGGTGNLYTEVAVGMSNNINDKWSVGGKFKFLYGHAHLSVIANKLDYTASANEFLLNGNAELNYSGPYRPKDIKALNPNYIPLDTAKEDQYGLLDFSQPCGVGMGADLGLTYRPIDELLLSAAVVDFGFLRWNRNNITKNYSIVNYPYYGVNSENGKSASNVQDSIINTFKNASVTSESKNPFYTYTTAKINIGAEYSFANNNLSLGLLSRTLIREKIYQELTTSFNVKPVDWFNMAISYSAMNGRFYNLGASIGLRTWIMHWFVAADYIPMPNYTNIYDSHSGAQPTTQYFKYTPTNTNQFNIALGVNFVFGNNKDSDKDGVIDRKDKCPDTPLEARKKVDKKGCPLDTDGDGVPDYLDLCANTPAGVQVDTVGCPLDEDMDGVPDYKDKCPQTPVASRSLVDTLGCSLDTDKDGVFDYLDKCPNTPLGVLVDSIGCPLDTDHDGVADYLDKCPGTSPEAIGMVDSTGCPLDSDGDGVPDYLDKCSNTPSIAIGFVDKFGCPIDTDDDGVADYLDKCPGTLAGARGYVDDRGCPLDSDKDGVPDFIDKCNNTPAEAIKLVDATGCPLDSDGDGVADYLDKCPNTPQAAKGFVDEKGCPIDTDADGVFDFEDNCPKIPGVSSNKGCPDIKKEVKKLFQKALQGIQFETGKAVIKPSSFAILDQIAKVLVDNPTYLVDVRGHTDNVGNSESNMQLSERRAAAVHDYLVGKGISLKRLSSHGYGDTKPVASNKTAKGKALNRRVEFVVTFEETTFE